MYIFNSFKHTHVGCLNEDTATISLHSIHWEQPLVSMKTTIQCLNLNWLMGKEPGGKAGEK